MAGGTAATARSHAAMPSPSPGALAVVGAVTNNKGEPVAGLPFIIYIGGVVTTSVF